jgi:hypothetical protein
MIVSIIGRLVTPQPVVFFPRQLRISSYEVPGRRHSRPVPEATDLFSRCTAPMTLHYPAGPRAQPPATCHLSQGSPLAAGSTKCFVFADKQYCE